MHEDKLSVLIRESEVSTMGNGQLIEEFQGSIKSLGEKFQTYVQELQINPKDGLTRFDAIKRMNSIIVIFAQLRDQVDQALL